MRKVLSLVTCCLVLLSGCATVGGVQVQGEAAQVTPPPSTPPPPSGAAPSVDPVAVLRTDPKVSAGIKGMLLTPCQADSYPVQARYADVTLDGSPELLVTVASCDSKLPAGWDYLFNLGVYVYAMNTTPPTQLFAVEEPGADITPQADFGLVVTHVRYKARDKSCCPSDSFNVAYKWNGTAFEQLKK